MNTDDELPPASPAESLRLIEAERAAAARSLYPAPLVWCGPWGVAWLVGFAVFFLRFGPDGRVFVDMPVWLPLVLLFALLAGALVVSTYLAAQTSRHIHGQSAVQGRMYGVAWAVTYTALGLTTGRFASQLSDAEGGLLWAALAVGATGVLHMAGGAIWLDKPLLRLGIWITVVNVAGVLAGPGWHSLLVSLAGGGGMLMLGTVLLLRERWR